MTSTCRTWECCDIAIQISSQHNHKLVLRAESTSVHAIELHADSTGERAIS